MTFSNDFSITKLFITKEIKVSIDNRYAFSIWAKPIKDFYTDDSWIYTFQILNLSTDKWKELIHLDLTESLEFFEYFVFKMGFYKEYFTITTMIEHQLTELCPGLEFDYQIQKIKINNITITPEIWNYLVYVVKLYSGEKVAEPLNFDSPEAKAFWLKQKALEDKIKKVRSNTGDKDSVIKTLLYITYCFPSLSFDFLFEQTPAQIHWLHEYAAKSVSYEVNAKAFAAGNTKKGKNLDFFIK